MYERLELVTDALSVLCESPVWDEKKQCLYYVDINGKRLRQVNMPSGEVADRVLPEQPGCVVLDDAGGLVCGLETGIYRITGRSLQKINKPFDMEGYRFNDGKVGPDGRLYIGTISRNFDGAFYRMEKDGEMVRLLSGVGNSNGLDWDLNRRLFYYNDTYKGTTDVFDWDVSTMELTGRRSLFEHGSGAPDGMTLDAKGNLWTALWGKAKVVCLNPLNKQIVQEYSLPAENVTCCAFGGEDFKTLFITTASRGSDFRKYPLAGAVWCIKTDVPGLPAHRLKAGELY